MKGYIISAKDVHWHNEETMTDVDIDYQKRLSEISRQTYILQCPKHEPVFEEEKILSPKQFGQARLNKRRKVIKKGK